ncbi:E3 ubiquitin-protein ligase TRIM17-like [Mauremys mutica]|uniref:E3 ubiquitin-protein ligase TRIM17-like n=1 Tax=Mauremys mutica TaxID=74926 RepID=UPI001D164851|nr:E3 ubiquitin-protein ligase TRIM17-like [Mauremys mutica]
MCKKHLEPLKFYCKEDQIPICVVCERSMAHRAHMVVPMEEAVQEHRETITEQLRAIESNFEKLHLFVNQVWKHFPQRAQKEEHQRLKTLIEKVATLFKVEVKSSKQRFEDRASQTQPPEPEVTSFSPGREIAVETELQGHKEREKVSEEVSEKQEEMASHVISFCEEALTPKYGLDHASLDPTIHMISNTTEDAEHKVDVMAPRGRFKESMSPNPSLDSGGKRKYSISPGAKVAAQPEFRGCEEKGGEVSTKGKEAATHKHMVRRDSHFLSPIEEYKQMVKCLQVSR